MSAPAPDPAPDAYALCRTLLRALADQPDLVELLIPLERRLRPRRHGPGFSSVLWDGTHYVFTASQARVVAVLWDAHQDGTPEVRQELLLEAAGSDAGRVLDLFRDHPAWGHFVVPGVAKGTFRLPAG